MSVGRAAAAVSQVAVPHGRGHPGLSVTLSSLLLFCLASGWCLLLMGEQ